MKTKPKNFIEQIIEDDLKAGLSKSELKFRFPPEPNGYLHVGHTKAIGLNFGLGKKYGASVNLRFDDTNPTKEDQEYVDYKISGEKARLLRTKDVQQRRQCIAF